MKRENKIVKTRPKPLSVSAAVKDKTDQHENDFFKWTINQAKYLKKRDFSKLDMENLIEEIESLGRSERRTLQSYLEVLLMHMLKAKYQSKKHTKSWDISIREASYKAELTLSKNPSLKPKLLEILKESYFSARLRAVLETGLPEEIFPEECPWKLKELFPDLEKKYSH